MSPNPTPRKHVILIGMPACGKSTVGVLVAKELGYGFVDSDLVIQETYGRRLPDLIREKGNEGFLSLEEEVNLSLGRGDTPTVIATGGSAVYSRAAMAHLREVGTVVYLRLSYGTVKRRLGNFTHRGVVMPEGYTLRRLYDERCALYETYADLIIDQSRRADISGTVQALCARIIGTQS